VKTLKRFEVLIGGEDVNVVFWTHYVYLYVDTNILEEYTTSIFRAYVPLKCWYLPTNPHGITAQKYMLELILSLVSLIQHGKSRHHQSDDGDSKHL
jgi:hypothetical protein